MSNVALSTASVPVGFCFTTWQESWPQLISLLTATADLSVNVHIGDTPPTDTSKSWIKTVSGVIEREYLFSSGVWLATHPILPGFRIIAPAGTALADLDTMDGGEAGAVTAYTGPMWEEDTDLAARFPVGSGTLPSGAMLAPDATGGDENIALTLAQIPPHHHIVKASQSDTEGGSSVQRLRPNAVESDSDVNTANTGGNADGTAADSHSNIPPYRVVIFIRRTARTKYRGT